MLPNAISICRKSLSIGILLLACFVLPAIGQVQSTLTDVHHDVSRPLRDMAAAAPAEAAVAPREAEPARLIPVPPGVKPSGVHRERDGLEEKNALERFAAKRH